MIKKPKTGETIVCKTTLSFGSIKENDVLVASGIGKNPQYWCNVMTGRLIPLDIVSLNSRSFKKIKGIAAKIS